MEKVITKNSNIVVTGANGFIGKNLCLFLNMSGFKNIIKITRDTSKDKFINAIINADFIFNLAGVNRPKDEQEFKIGNADFTKEICDILISNNKCTPIMLSSSTQSILVNPYGKSKLMAEKIVCDYSKKTGADKYIYRFPNVFGKWCKPNYNSAVATFCWAIANDKEYIVNDRNTELELLYIDDLVEGMLDLLNRKEICCEFDGTKMVISNSGKYCCVPKTYKVTLGKIVDLLQEFKEQPITLMMPKCPEGSFEKKLFSSYLTYLPKEKIKYLLKMNVDDRGSFTELIHTNDCGQVSINICKPGITKGQHWHNSKWEQFIVVQGRGLIRERNMDTGEIIEFEVSGDKIEVIYMIPGWTHSITNLSKSENLVTVMTCNEIFNVNHSDTYFEKV